MSIRILLAEDDELMRVTVQDHLRDQGWIVDEAVDGHAALALMKQQSYEVVVSDIRMPGLDGTQLLQLVKTQSPNTDVIMMTAYGSADDAVQCLKKGAADYILKPFDLDDLTIRIKRLVEMQEVKARCISSDKGCFSKPTPIIGSSLVIQKMLSMVSQVAVADATVLIHGESGTGKELVAAALHYGSKRASKPYIRLNCAAIPAGLLESELFGHEKGAFTGADQRKIGKFELADQGTILLDEIGDMPLELQVKILRVLQEREVERVGGGIVHLNVRVICATSKDLKQLVAEGKFREDLYYRLQVIPLEVPPLRERENDVLELCAFFLQGFSLERGLTFRLSQEAQDTLAGYRYPGNVRELRNILERVSVLAPAPTIQVWDLPSEIQGTDSLQDVNYTLANAVAHAEKKCILQALRKTTNNKTQAAVLLGISRKNLWEKMKGYGLHA
ncbi:MAG: sigma-54 dependent transcriptional regulator [Desulfobulbaceae bacterium]|jgi:two-component system response regulator AtoC|nr:sigma-54 dependent transcriptional regulator [Desulfobulbaceae bacterium]